MEKTFEELIDEKFRHYADFYKPILIELLQQVREATIAECFKPYFNSHIGFIIMEKYKNGVVVIQQNKKVYENLTSAHEAVEHYKQNVNNNGSEYKILPITLVRDLPTDRIKIEPVQ